MQVGIEPQGQHPLAQAGLWQHPLNQIGGGEEAAPASQGPFAVSLGGHGLFTYLLNKYDVLVLSCAKLAEPVLAAAAAAWLYHEPLSAHLGAAFILIAAGVVVLLRSPKTKAMDALAADG